MNRHQVEVLAPAGSFESMKAAVAAGADAVYIGGARFGARAYANNLDEERMLEAIDYCHLHGVSLYMTVNTLMKEGELGELDAYLRPYYERGLDAVIVQDLGVFAHIRKHFPLLPIHASTQMTITGYHGARILKDLGAARVVTARELSLSEIRKIHEEVDIEIESFVHGALCYCYSGQCFLSSFIGGRSGNRGRCAQPCRLPYQAQGSGQKQSYLLSLKDLCTLDILPDLLEAGIYSLKIEGRMKSPRYTAGVVEIYRKYVDRYLAQGRDGYQVETEDRQMLLDLFDRGGQTEGYYRQHNGKDMVVLKEKPAFRESNQKLLDRLDDAYVNGEKKEPVRGKVTVEEGSPMVLQLTGQAGDKTVSVQVTGAVAQTAQNQPMTEEKLEKQLKKTGNTPFVLEDLKVDLRGHVFVPVQALNELRRSGLEALEDAILKTRRRDPVSETDGWEKTSDDGSGSAALAGKAEMAGKVELAGDAETAAIHVLLSGPEGLAPVLACPEVEEIQAESDGWEPDEWKSLTDACHQAGKRCVLAMPVIFRTHAERFFDSHLDHFKAAGFDGILVRALEEVDYLKSRQVELPLYGDHNLYAFNSQGAKALGALGLSRLTLPLELNGREIEELLHGMGESGSPLPAEFVAYGYLPSMVSAQCIKKTQGRCDHRMSWTALRDRTGKELPVRSHCRYCYNVIYNPSPLWLVGQERTIRRMGPAALRLQFTEETEVEIRQILKAYVDGFRYGKEASASIKDFTRGHLKRGVE